MLLALDTSSYRLAAGIGGWHPLHSPPMRFEHFLGKAAELDLPAISISDLPLLERADYGYLSGLRRAAEQAGVSLELTYSGFRAEHLQDAIRVAGALGCKSIIFRPEFERPHSEKAMAARLEELHHVIAQALPMAERYALLLALSGAGRLTAKELLRLYKAAQSELVSIALDPASALCVLEDPVAWAELLGGYAACLQISDYQIASASDGARLYCCPFGEGMVNIPALLEIARKSSLEVAVSVATPSEMLHLPLLDDLYLERFQELRPIQLARMVRLIKERGKEPAPVLLQNTDLSEDEILAVEEDRFEQSLEWLRGRMDESQIESEI